ncbi:hypothetical protein AcV5_009738 [Taiwanofungus camphoratus]|nr:hypothetical protein AcV5_009738 [Antrodia cinnamomea]KAI0942796.1 hypothetical protein AcV7_002106 [Antrodia cinnamomea]
MPSEPFGPEEEPMEQSKKIEWLEAKVREMGHMHDKLRREIFDAAQRGHRLAHSMGFESIEEAESAISSRPHIFHRTSIEHAESRVGILEGQLADHIRLNTSAQNTLGHTLQLTIDLRKENTSLTGELTEAKCEASELKKRLSEFENVSDGSKPFQVGLQTPASSIEKKQPLQDGTTDNPSSKIHARQSHQQSSDGPLLTSSSAQKSSTEPSEDDPAQVALELRELRRKYAALRQAKERNDAKYKSDYLKWKKFKQWIYDEEGDSMANGITDGKTPKWSRVLRMREEFAKVGPRVSSPTNSKEGVSAKIECVTPPTNDRDAPADPLSNPKSVMVNPPLSSLAARLFGSGNVEKETVKSPRLPSVSLLSNADSQPTLDSVASGPPSSPIHRSKKRKFEEAMSSETEDDSQAPEPIYSTQPGLRRRAPSMSNRVQEVPLKDSGAPGDRSKLPQSTRMATSSHVPSSQTTPTPRSSKEHVPRSSSVRNSATRRRSSKKSGASSPSTPATKTNGGKENMGSASAGKRYPQDYSIYKGRGRYAAEASASKNTINAVYRIDSEKNGGVDFQFDNVVRNAEDRKQLHAVDCKCCHSYYKAIGPLPPRLQRPLWRSPESTPSKHHKDRSDSPDVITDQISHPTDLPAGGEDEVEAAKRQEQAIVEHMHEISRHRHQWEPASTPPSYWNIGFPDTQEAAAINKRAQEMHEQKRAKVDMEARQGGRYKKR